MEFLVLLFSPSYVLAVSTATNPTIKELVYRISYYILNPLIKIGFVAALVYFFWGVIEYLYDRNSGRVVDTTAVGGKGGKGADQIVYGLFGLFAMASAFGIMHLMKSLTGSTIPIP